MSSVRWTRLTIEQGELFLAETATGLLRVAFEQEDFEQVIARLEVQTKQELVYDPQSCSAATQQISEYFAGDRQTFDVKVDPSLSAGFQLNVRESLKMIPYGQTRSYGQVAQQLGRARAARAVGTACAKNPLPLIWPCHRVVRSDGGLGDYLGGPALKKYLLSMEATHR